MDTVFWTTDQERRATVFGLTVSCPFDQGNPSECPLHKARQMNLKQRLEWINGLSESELQKYLDHHNECAAYQE